MAKKPRSRIVPPPKERNASLFWDYPAFYTYYSKEKSIYSLEKYVIVTAVS